MIPRNSLKMLTALVLPARDTRPIAYIGSSFAYPAKGSLDDMRTITTVSLMAMGLAARITVATVK